MPVFNRQKPDINHVYQCYSDILYRVALAQLGSDADAQDAVQDVFVKYITSNPVFHTKDHERAWLLRVTVNRCRDLQRKNKIRSVYSADFAETENTAAADSRIELFETLSSVPEKYRDIVILHCLEGLTLQECAEVLRISLSAAKMRLSRAREALRKE